MKRTLFVIALLILAGLTGITSSVEASGKGIARSAQGQKLEAIVPLDGLDPVMLVQGKEIQGKEKFSVIRGQFQYLFASEENKALFEKNPTQYEIQLGGTCARMGPAAGGSPDLYTVHNKRIYIFGSANCKELFEAAPEKYLETAPAAAPVAGTPEAVRKGRALIEKAVVAMGGTAKIDAMTSYQSRGATLQNGPDGSREVKTALTIVFPDRIRHEQTIPSFGVVATVVAPGQAFITTPRGTRPMLELQRAEQQKQDKRNAVVILRARKNADFKAVSAGPGKIGETVVEQVAVEFDGVATTLGIDPASGRILSLSFRGRGHDGVIGTIARVFSDFRNVDGLNLPFKMSVSFNGEPDPSQSYTTESITINSKLDPMIFERPDGAARR
jgi:YHS domain-containing protein